LKNIHKRKKNVNIQTKIGKKKEFIGKARANKKKMGGIANKGVSMTSTNK